MVVGKIGCVYPWQQVQWAQLNAMRREDRLPHALLLTGAQGMGKRDFAKALARAQLCRYRTREGVACGKCDSCKQYEAGTHPDFFAVQPEAEGKAIPVDSARAVGEFLTLKSHHGAGRVVLLSPAEAMNVAAANSLLKTLEEPPSGSLLILVSSSPGALLATVRSRCQRMVFLPEKGIAGRWLSERLQGEDGKLLLNLAGGAPLRALELGEEGLLERRAQLLEDFERIAKGRCDPVSAAQRWLKEERVDETVFWLNSWLMDMLRLKYVPSPPEVVNQDVVERLRELAARCDGRRLFSFHQRVAEAVQQLNRSLNLQLMLEDLFIVWARLAQAHDKQS